MNKNQLTMENFMEMIMIYSKDNFLTETLIETIFYNIAKMDRILTLEEFKKEYL